jgi:hypothetical protein
LPGDALTSTVRAVREPGGGIRIIVESEASGPLGAAQTTEPLPDLDYRPSDTRYGSWTASSDRPARFTALVRVPDTGSLSARVASFEYSGAAGDAPDPMTLGLVEVSRPAIMRDLRLVAITIRPAAEEVGLLHSAEIVLDFGPGPGVNERRSRVRPPSPAFERLYERRVLNYRPAAEASTLRDASPSGARYLIIAADTYASDIAPLVEWKSRKGLLPLLVTLSETGSTPGEIRAYIQNAYETWEIPPEYVLLVGDTELLPGYEDLTYTDNYYAAIDGTDYLADVLVGRLSADSHSQCQTEVAKCLGYERTPARDDADWPTSATLMINCDNDDGDWVYFQNTGLICDLMQDAAFAPVDTLFERLGNVSTSEVYASINDGRGFLNFRGQAWYEWPAPFDVNPSSTTSGWHMPIVISATCATGEYMSDGFMCETWVRAGTATSPKGGVAFFGTTTSHPGDTELALRRGYVDEGFFETAFDGGAVTLGEACLGGKLKLFKMAAHQEEYEGWNLLGDPDLSLWTGAIRDLAVSHDDGILVGQPQLTVRVTDASGYVEGALVACVKDGESYAWGYTDALGEATIPVSAATEGVLSVTVTAANACPYEGEVQVLESGPYPVFHGVTVDDSAGGNGDGHLSPGESATLFTSLKNLGDETATSIEAIWRSPDGFVTAADSTAWFDDIAPDSVLTGHGGFEVAVSPGCPGGHLLYYAIEITHAGGDVTQYPAPIEIETGDLTPTGISVEDDAPGGDGSAGANPGETVGLVVSLENVGACDLTGVTLSASTTDPYAVVTSGSASLGDAPSGATVTNDVVPFVVSISPSTPDGHDIAIDLDVSADGGRYQYAATRVLSLPVSGAVTILPSGPDEYGYYIYDQNDSLFGPAPVFDWYDIAPPGPGNIMEDITDADAAITTFALLWNFKYYGVAYNQVSVNSNGFLTLDWSDYRLGDNTPIPDPRGPARMVAPLWDDLDPSAGGDIYKWLDTANHRWIVQFDHVRHWGSTDAETFQVILLNPAYYPSPTGDGQIIIQYEDVSQVDGCTVGIENAEQDDGIQYLYNGSYDGQATPLEPGTALLITTIPPTGAGLPWLVVTDYAIDDSGGGNGNGVAEPGETVVLEAELTNRGGLDAPDVSVEFSSNDGLTSFSDSTAATVDLPSGASAWTTPSGCVFTVSQAVYDTVATVWATVTSEGSPTGGAQRIELHIALPGTGVPDDGVPLEFAFRPVAPNPFAAGTTMRLALPATERVTLRVYTVSGRLVRTLVDETLSAGDHALTWDGRDRRGRACASGVYLVRLEAGGRTASRKAVLIR